MVNEDEGKREKWTTSEMSVDHPLRKAEGVRDPTIFTGGLTTSLTGMHCNKAVLDDVVVQENAYTKDGRTKVKEQYSLLASIETTDAEEWVVGTRYNPDDLYGEMMEMVAEEYDKSGELINRYPIYEVYQKEVEDVGDGTGEYLWPRQQRADGRWFGFDQKILSRKRAQYLDKSQFRAQYYNNPNDSNDEAVPSSLFQYYDKRYLIRDGAVWTFKKKPLSTFAAIDFAFSLTNTSDYTAIVVIGMDVDGNIYVLDIDRFRTKSVSDYFSAILALHTKWGFRKIRAEVNAAQAVIVNELKNLIRSEGLVLSIDETRPTRTDGMKEERILAGLLPRYENQSIWHFEGGLCLELEEELKQQRPRNDDIKDALYNAVSIASPPRKRISESNVIPITTHARFGGVSFR